MRTLVILISRFWTLLYPSSPWDETITEDLFYVIQILGIVDAF